MQGFMIHAIIGTVNDTSIFLNVKYRVMVRAC